MKNKKNRRNIVAIVAILLIITCSTIYVLNNKHKANKIEKYRCSKIMLNIPVFAYENGEYTRQQDKEKGTFNSDEDVVMTFKNGNLIKSKREVVYEFTQLDGYKQMRLWQGEEAKVFYDEKALTKTIHDDRPIIEYTKEYEDNMEEYIQLYKKNEYVCINTSSSLKYVCDLTIENDDLTETTVQNIYYKSNTIMKIDQTKTITLKNQDLYTDIMQSLSYCNKVEERDGKIICAYVNNNPEIESLTKYAQSIQEHEYKCELKED